MELRCIWYMEQQYIWNIAMYLEHGTVIFLEHEQQYIWNMVRTTIYLEHGTAIFFDT